VVVGSNFEGTLTPCVRGTLKILLRVVRGLREPLNPEISFTGLVEGLRVRGSWV
jgi:hypothetical protein